MNQLIQQVETNIQRVGWSVIAVNGDPTINMPYGPTQLELNACWAIQN